MFFQTEIIAILMVSGIGVLSLILTSPLIGQLILKWNLTSGDELQLRLERRTYLLTLIIRLVLFSQLFALLLFVFNADKMAIQFVGAMCAVGTLQVNEFGFSALYLQIILFFASALWLIVDYVDNRARNYPLVRSKFLALLVLILPLLISTLILQILYFGNLEPDTITSCCGSLFSNDNNTVTGELVGFPPAIVMKLFYGGILLTIFCNLAFYFGQKKCPEKKIIKVLATLAGVFSGGNFILAIVGVISFLSLYIYENPNHHCPFCLLKAEYYYIGYCLYLPLLIASITGMAVGLVYSLKGVQGLELIVPKVCNKLVLISVCGWAIFLIFASGIIWNSRLILIGN